MGALIDLTGKRFGNLVVIEKDVSRKIGYSIKAVWLCRCDCGNYVSVYGSHLKNGNTKSCGCIKLKHGQCGKNRTRLYVIWYSMIGRCQNPNKDGYQNYGGRGISVCDEWRHNFVAFRDWAMTNGYADNLSIDRIDTDGDYTPENCRWATQKEQCNNKRQNHRISVDGNMLTLSEASEKYGISYNTVRNRICLGWSLERIISTPVRSFKREQAT